MHRSKNRDQKRFLLFSKTPVFVVMMIVGVGLVPMDNTLVCAQEEKVLDDKAKQQKEDALAPWMKEGLTAAFPAHYAQGVVRGKNVAMKQAIYRTLSGELLLEGDGYSLSILLPQGEPKEGKTIVTGVIKEIDFADTARRTPASGFLGNSAATRVSFGKLKNNVLPGYVIVRCVDDQKRKQFIEGYFYAAVRKGIN